MNDFQPNGLARIATKVRFHGIAVRHGKDPNEESVRECPARITTKLVSTYLERFDRVTGRDRARRANRIGLKGSRLVAYRLANQEWQAVSGSPHTQEPR